jgi:hypothetical protein
VDGQAQLEGVQEFGEGGQGGVAFAAFDPADVGLGDAGAVGELDLGQVQLGAAGGDGLTEGEGLVVGVFEVSFDGLGEPVQGRVTGGAQRGDDVLV